MTRKLTTRWVLIYEMIACFVIGCAITGIYVGVATGWIPLWHG